jgi:predicted HTH domain antitoxin
LTIPELADIMELEGVSAMATNTITIPYSDDLLLSMKKSPEEFKAEARLLLAIKLYELGRVSTGVAAELAGISRVAFIFELARFGLSPMGQTPDEVGGELYERSATT